jgi:hypothetical protein
MSHPLDLAAREDSWTRLNDGNFDVLVIGGGLMRPRAAFR